MRVEHSALPPRSSQNWQRPRWMPFGHRSDRRLGSAIWGGGAEEAGVEPAFGLRDLRLRDGGPPQPPELGLCAPVEGVLRGHGGVAGRAAFPRLP